MLDGATFDRPASRRTTRLIAAAVFLAGGLVPLEVVASTAWSSDDVGWQVAFRTWRPHQSTLYLPSNLYILRWPALVGADRLLPPSPTVLFALSWIFNACGLLLIWWSARQILRWDRPAGALSVRSELIAAGLTIVPLIAPRMIRFENRGLTTRNIETGIYLAVIVIAFAWLTGRRRTPTIAGWIGVVLGVGLLGLNDPLVIYTVIVPIAAAALVTAAARRCRRGLGLGLAFLGGVVAWRVGTVIVAWTGITQANPPTEPVFDQWSARLRTLANIILGGFGLIPFGSRYRIDFVLAFCAGCGVVGLIGYGLLGPWRRRVPLPALAGLVWLGWAAVVYFMSVGSLEPQARRYVAVAFSGVVPIAAWTANRVRRGLPLVAVLVVVAVVNPIVTAFKVNAEQLPPVGTELARGLDATVTSPTDDVYATYWDASISTYYGDGRFASIPTVCPGGRPVYFPWISDTTAMDRAVADVGPSLFVLGPGCEADVVAAAFGQPDRVISAGETEIWVYERELSQTFVD